MCVDNSKTDNSKDVVNQSWMMDGKHFREWPNWIVGSTILYMMVKSENNHTYGMTRGSVSEENRLDRELTDNKKGVDRSNLLARTTNF